MSKRKTPDTDVEPIQASIGKGLFNRIFGGNTFIHCIVELTKNSRDWEGTLVLIETAVRHQMRIVDNGDGMNAKNRNAFTSLNESSASADQSGKFGSGSKKMFYSFSTSVQVVTAPKDKPDVVYIFDFTTDEYEELALTRGKKYPQRIAKTEASWPYDFDYGTEITFELANPDNKHIMRGTRLAQELAARFPKKLLERIRVDGMPLPEKSLVGELFEVVEMIPRVGAITLELYRPAKARAEERLRVGGVEVGEATFDELLAVMPSHLAERIPPLFLMRVVCGTITARFLGEHANENRITLNPAVGEDARLVQLVEMLRRHAPEIQRKLGIRFGADTERESDGSALVRDVVAAFNTTYGGKNVTLPTADGANLTGSGGGGGGRKTSPAFHLHLDHASREYEPGDKIVVRAGFHKQLRHTANDVNWDLSNARGATIVEKNPDSVVLQLPSDAGLGNGRILADIPRSPHSADARFEVVRQRTPKLSLAPAASIVCGRQLTLRVHNPDKLQGVAEWEILGVGELTPNADGTEALYTGNEVGIATVSVHDSKDRRVTDVCELTIAPPPQLVIKIRKHVLRVDFLGITDNEEFECPVIMVPMSAEYGDMLISTQSPAYQAALKSGRLPELLMTATAMEYGRFALLDAAGEERVDVTTLDPRDVPNVMQRVNRLGFQVLAEMLEKMKPLSGPVAQ